MKYTVLILLLFSNTILASIINPGDTNSYGCEILSAKTPICLSISLIGEIEKGDSKRLQELINHFSKDGMVRIGKLHLSSMGGDLVEALEIGNIVREHKIFTSVDPNKVCYSSCSLIYFSGVYRVPFGEIGIHSFYSKELLGSNNFSTANEGYEKISELLVAYFKKMRVPQAVLSEMNAVPHTKIRILSGDELASWGMVGFDPVYFQVRKCIDNCVPDPQ